MSFEEQTVEAEVRQRRLAVLACAACEDLVRLWTRLGFDPAFDLLRGPETGLVMLRGRIGGGGAPFNFGEATVTRATVRLKNGAVGHAMVLGHDTVHARLAAVVDAAAQVDGMAARVERDLLVPLAALQAENDDKRAAETAATRVNFFTMARGDD